MTAATVGVGMDVVDELLLGWYEWNQDYAPALGFRRAASESRDFKISRQWMEGDDVLEEVEDELKAEIGRAVEPFVFQLSLAHRVAIQTHLRNLQAGATVWSSARAGDYAAAKSILKQMFSAHGLLRKVPRSSVFSSDLARP
jgi:hypothetical protein